MNEADKDRKKALKTLFTNYWSSRGWKPERDQVTPADDFLHAKRAEVMFDPVRLSHEEIVRRAGAKITGEQFEERTADYFGRAKKGPTPRSKE